MTLSNYLTTFLTLTSITLNAADWPAWRGIDGRGLSAEKGVPLQWSKDQNIAWRTVLVGKGASSPIVVGNRIYLTSQTSDNGLHVLALDTETGAVVWDTEVGRGKLPAHNLHNMATPTAVSDGKSVWALFGTGDYARIDFNGKIIWSHNFVKGSSPIKTNHGYGISPVLLEGRLYLSLMHQGPSWIMAIDAATGHEVWRRERSSAAIAEAQDSYSTPCLLRHEGTVQLVVAGAEVLNAYDPVTGAEVWKVDGIKVPHPYGRTIAGPTAGEGAIVTVASGFQNRGFTQCIRAGGQGNLTATHSLWSNPKFSADCPTPVIYKGLLFTIRDDGMASCLDLKTGEAKWQERLFTDNVKVSPVIAEGRVYFLSGQAQCVVVNATSEFKILARNELKESTLSSPAIARKSVYLRTDEALYCVRKS